MEEEILSRLRSDEEHYIYWYFLELQKAGYIDKIEYEVETFALGNRHHRWEADIKKTKIKMVERLLVDTVNYTPDFTVTWNEKAKHVFYQNVYDNVVRDCFFISNLRQGKEQSCIEVKGHTSNPKYNDADTFTKMKWVFFQHNVYVQKVVPTPKVTGISKKKYSPLGALFLSTFTPTRYLLTNKSGQKRKINYPVRTLQEYLADK